MRNFLLFVLFCYIFAHFRLIHPVPRNTNSGIKRYPCGSDPFFGPGQKITTLTPGEMTLKWEETISHKGAPFQVAISVNDDSNYQRMILVDHIPHNDEGN